MQQHIRPQSLSGDETFLGSPSQLQLYIVRNAETLCTRTRTRALCGSTTRGLKHKLYLRGSHPDP